MKKILTILSTLLMAIATYAQSQGPDFYDSIESTQNDKIIIFDAEQMFNSFGPYLYTMQKGKLKPIKDGASYAQLLNGKILYSEGVEAVKNKTYLKLCDTNEQTYYLITGPKYDYTGNIRSYSFWLDLKDTADKRYSYAYANVDSDGDPRKEYFPIEWQYFTTPQTIKDNVKFMFLLSDETKAIDGIEILKQNDKAFISESEYSIKIEKYKARKERERLDSLRDQTPIIADVNYSFTALNAFKDAGGKLEHDNPEQIYLYEAINGNKYKGYCKCHDITINGTDITFRNPDDIVYLKRRGENGAEVRKLHASIADMENFEKLIDEMKAENDKQIEYLNKILSFYDKKKIFITGQEYSYGEFSQFGLRFKFYNCYSKEIKYVELKITPYNAVNDIVRDDIGRSIREIQCIGPIEKGDIVTYDFNDLYWDDRNIIEKLIVSRLKIIFMDGSTVVYSSPSQIDSHRSSNYTAKDMGVEEE